MRTFSLAALSEVGALEETMQAAQAAAIGDLAQFSDVGAAAGVGAALACLAGMRGREGEVVPLLAGMAEAVAALAPRPHGQALGEAHCAIPGVIRGGDWRAIAAKGAEANAAMWRERAPGGAWRAPVKRTPDSPKTRDFAGLVECALTLQGLATTAGLLLRDGMSAALAEDIRGTVQDQGGALHDAMARAFAAWAAEDDAA